MNASIFTLGVDNQLKEFRRSAYESEDIFQQILADHPTMLSGAAGSRGKLLLVRREQPVPDQNDGAERWSLDHLFLDSDGVPVLIEVKRATDTRARREVVAQMLDYAANGVAYWPIDRMMTAYSATVAEAGRDPNVELSAFLEGAEPETFWRQVEANLRSGRIRMVFVADRIPKELARIVEFLNEQMRPAEVLAIEIEHFTGADGTRTLVPRLVGATARAQTAKSVQPLSEPLPEKDWLRTIAAKFGEKSFEGAVGIVGWLRENGIEVEQTKSQDSLVGMIVRPDGKPCWPFFVRRSSGRVEIAIGNLTGVRAFASEQARRSLLDKIKQMPVTSLKITEKLNGWPSIALEEIVDAAVWREFCAIALHIALEIRGTSVDAESTGST